MVESSPRHSSSAVPVLQSPAHGYANVSTPKAQTAEEREEVEESLLHGINSFWALATPVAITMILASFVVVHYESESITKSMGSYLVYDANDEDSSKEVVGHSLVNALVVIGFVTLMTFGMVLLYKYNCMKFLVGYIMFASAGILSFIGGQLIDIILNEHFEWPVDWISFLYIMYNFGIVGVISVFYQKGTPAFLQHAYLVLISAILAWQFSMWPEWTTWIFVNMFAVYDLCAVLTPCGPLKCLINLIQTKQQPMPGLLYEADVRDGVRQNVREERTGGSSRAASPTTNAPNNYDYLDNEQDVESAAHSPKVNTAATYPPNVESEEEFKEMVTLFYEKNSPRDVAKVDTVVEKFYSKQQNMWPLLYHKYQVCSCLQGVLCPFKVYLNMRAQEEEEEDKTIKLGLGDFIFYSVLCGRAALFDVTTLFQCFLSILLGLGATLFLLSVLHKALPALPFSIFLASAMYFWTRSVLIDYVDFILSFPVAV